MDLRDPRIGKAALLALMVLAGLAILYTLALGRTLFFPLVLALLLDSLLSPLVRRLVNWSVPRSLAAVIVLVGWLAATAALLWVLFQPAMTWIRDAPEQLQRMEQELRAISQPIEQVEQATAQLDAMTDTQTQGEGAAVAEVEVTSVSISDTLLNNTGEVLVGVLLAIVLLYFLLAGGERLLEKFVESAARFKDKRRIVEVTRKAQENVSRYLVTVTAINAGLGVVIGAGMWLLGLPDPLLWGVMAALLNYIPFLGLFLGSVVVFVVAAASPDVTAPILAPAIYLLANAIEANFVTPLLLGRWVSLDPVVLIVFFTVVVWMWSIGGAIVAVPLLAVIKIVCEHFEPLHPAARLIGR